MKKLNYLSQEFVEIDKIMNYKISYDFGKQKDMLGWCDCPVESFECGTSWNYYKINLQKGKVITVGKNSSCQLRKIETGLFKGCYCVVEAKKGEDSFTILYIFDKTKILKYPEMEKYLTAQQVDSLLEQKQIEKAAAKLLNQFDITKSHQDYEMFCDNLPHVCWKQKDFAKNILTMFEAMGEIDLQTRVDKKFVKLDLCKEIARKYFVNLTKKRTQEKTL